MKFSRSVFCHQMLQLDPHTAPLCHSPCTTRQSASGHQIQHRYGIQVGVPASFLGETDSLWSVPVARMVEQPLWRRCRGGPRPCHARRTSWPRSPPRSRRPRSRTRGFGCRSRLPRRPRSSSCGWPPMRGCRLRQGVAAPRTSASSTPSPTPPPLPPWKPSAPPFAGELEPPPREKQTNGRRIRTQNGLGGAAGSRREPEVIFFFQRKKKPPF